MSDTEGMCEYCDTNVPHPCSSDELAAGCMGMSQEKLGSRRVWPPADFPSGKFLDNKAKARAVSQARQSKEAHRRNGGPVVNENAI
jgi:hypothetical protein